MRLISLALFLYVFHVNAQDINVDYSTLLIKYNANTKQDDLDEIHKHQGGNIIKFKHLNWHIVKFSDKKKAEQAKQNYKKSKLIKEVEYNQICRITETIPNDPLYPQLWGMQKIQASLAWDKIVSNNVVVAIIDTGIDFNHEDLKDNLWTGPSGEHGYTASGGIILPGGFDDHYHGTHVAGTIGAIGNNSIGVVGLNWRGIKLLAFKFLSTYGSGTTADAILCIEKMVDLKLAGENIRVSNNSWGGGGYSEALEEAFKLAENAGILNICAAGNDSLDNDENPFYPASLLSEGIITVLASDESDNRAFFSNYGLISTDLFAPGYNILSCKIYGGYHSLSGTSMATPHVAGVCALMFGIKPSLTLKQCKNILLDPSSFDFVNFTLNTTFGGRLNASKAIINALLPIPPDNHNPVLTINGTNLVIIPVGNIASMSASGTDIDSNKLNFQIIAKGSHNDSWLIGSMVNESLYNRQVITNTISITNLPTGRDYVLNTRFNLTDGHGGLDSKFGSFFLPRDESKVRQLSTPVVSLIVEEVYPNFFLFVEMPGINTNEAKLSWNFSSSVQGAGKTCCFPVNTKIPLYSLNFPYTGPHIYDIQVMDHDGNFTSTHFVYDKGNTGFYAPEAKVKLNIISGESPLVINVDMKDSDVYNAHNLKYTARYWVKNDVIFDGYEPIRTFTLTNLGLNAIQFVVYDETNNLTALRTELFTVLPPKVTNQPPPVVLNPPTDLRITQVNNNQLILNWTDTSSGEDSWLIEVGNKVKGKVTYRTLVTLVENSNNYSFQFTGLGAYQFRVKACKIYKCSDYSNVVTIKIR